MRSANGQTMSVPGTSHLPVLSVRGSHLSQDFDNDADRDKDDDEQAEHPN